jgi:hypothetical protein
LLWDIPKIKKKEGLGKDLVAILSFAGTLNNDVGVILKERNHFKK